MHAYHYRESRYWRRRDRPRPHVILWVSPRTGRRLSRAFPTRTKARNFQRWIDRQLNQPLYGPEDPSWESLIRQYSDVKADASKSHRAALFRTLATFWKVCRPRRLSEITPAMIDRYFADFVAGRIPSRKVTPSERAKDYANLHAFFQLWVNRGMMPANPLRDIRKPRAPQATLEVPTTDEWVQLLEVLPRRDLWLEDPQAWHVYILLAAVTGLDRDHLLRMTLRSRATEPLEITVKLGTNATDGVGLIQTHRPKTIKTGGQLIYKGLPPLVSDRVAARINDLPVGSTYLLPWRNFQRKQWERIARTAHFNHPFRTLRHACGTQAAEAQALEAGRQALGHSSVRLTERHYLEAQRTAIAVALRLALPPLPPLPPYYSPEQRKQRLRGKPGRRPARSG